MLDFNGFLSKVVFTCFSSVIFIWGYAVTTVFVFKLPLNLVWISGMSAVLVAALVGVCSFVSSRFLPHPVLLGGLAGICYCLLQSVLYGAVSSVQSNLFLVIGEAFFYSFSFTGHFFAVTLLSTLAAVILRHIRLVHEKPRAAPLLLRYPRSHDWVTLRAGREQSSERGQRDCDHCDIAPGESMNGSGEPAVRVLAASNRARMNGRYLLSLRVCGCDPRTKAGYRSGQLVISSNRVLSADKSC